MKFSGWEKLPAICFACAMMILNLVHWFSQERNFNMQAHPYFDLSLLEPKRFYTRTKACTILDIDPDVFDTIIFANIQSYSNTDSETRIFTGAEIIGAVDKYYLKILQQAIVTDLSSLTNLNDSDFQAKYGVTRQRAADITDDPQLLRHIYDHILLENYYPVPKGERKRH